ncbi:MAG: hypothetical protein B7Z66_09145 [Chromatiales bacterium 21-64-14]|nr:MAG: hypothetical protein B7Z66_09145 [Chromatiales bacterium 21-64-14]HQU15276.1 hypothetical protein [Gammaproteobacteria bacterium]
MRTPSHAPHTPPVPVAVTYRTQWRDGFGARGWKLDVTVDDPEVIASTAYTGERIPTSVLVHDLLDHHLCGFPISGHRCEAMALVQLALRTGSDPRTDYRQMTDEDILHGRVNGERLEDFLPPALRCQLPSGKLPDRERMQRLVQRLGYEAVREAIVDRFLELGRRGMESARRTWEEYGLDYGRRPAIGLCLQGLLEQADHAVLERAVTEARGLFFVGNEHCALLLADPARREFKALVNHRSALTPCDRSPHPAR